MAAVCINRHLPPPSPPSSPSSSTTSTSSSSSLHSPTLSSRLLGGAPPISGSTVSAWTAAVSPPSINHHLSAGHQVTTSTMNAAGEETATHSSLVGTTSTTEKQPPPLTLNHNCNQTSATVLKSHHQPADEEEGDDIVIVYGRSMSSPAAVSASKTTTTTTTTSTSAAAATDSATPSSFSSLPPYSSSSPSTAASSSSSPSFPNSSYSSTSCNCSSSLSTLNSSFSSSSSSSNASSPTPTILCYAPTATILPYHRSASSDASPHHPYHHDYHQQQQSNCAPCSLPVNSECSDENQEEQQEVQTMQRSISQPEASPSVLTSNHQSSSSLCAMPPSVVISDHSLDEVVVIHHHLHHDHYSTDHQFPYYINGLSGGGSGGGQGHCSSDDGNLFGNGSGDVQRRRDSLASICSSTSSLSSLGEDDIYFEGTCAGEAASGGPDGSLNATSVQTSPWRKVRSLVTSPFIQTYKRQKYPWIQLAGHQGNFLAGQMQGTILKKKSGNEDKCFQALMEDELRDFVPQFKNVVHMNGESYIELEDLLASFSNPSIMDIKMGIRTYLEEELIKAGEKPKLRKDMYEKMVAIDPREPTEEEHAQRAVTKPRYMVWRESISSTSTLGFRIDGVKLRQTAAAAAAAAAAAGNGNGAAATAECDRNRTNNKDFKRTKTEQSVSSAILQFAEEKPECIEKYLNKLRLIRETMSRSAFFRSHEMIGSSLLFVHDDTHADIWLIDFAKTYPLPAGVSISHRDQWTLGNHEDGYLTGLDNLIRLFSALQSSNA